MSVPRMIMAEWRNWRRRGDGLPVGLMMLLGAVLYGWLLVRLQIPHTLAELVMGFSTNTTAVLILITTFGNSPVTPF